MNTVWFTSQMLLPAFVAGSVAFAVALLIVCTPDWRGNLSSDSLFGVQNFHTNPISRVGGVAIAVGLIVGYFFAQSKIQALLWPLLLVGIPGFAFGLLQDLTKGLSIQSRLVATKVCTRSPSLPFIVHFGKFYFPDVGGIETVTASVAENAEQAGYAVSVVCFSGERPAAEREMINRVNVLRAKQTLNIGSQPLSLDYLRQALRVARNATVVHLHAPNLLAALCSLLLRPRIRLLVHWHGDIRNKGLLGSMIRPIEQRYLQRADVIVITSEVYGRTSEALQPFQKKLQVVPIGVPDPALIVAANSHTDASITDAWESRLQNRRVILSVGRLVPFKGFDVLIDAAKLLENDVAIVIVGDGPERADLQARIDAAGLWDKVFLTGTLPGRQFGATLHRLYQRADLYCLASVDRSESFGVVLIEAMSYGTPCLVSNIPGSGVTWVSENGVSGATFPVANAPALAREAMRLLNDHRELQRLGEGARMRYLALFTEDAATRRMLEVYNDLF